MVSLKRELEYTDVVMATIGYVIGAGIYAVIGVASKYGKNLTWLSVMICGLMAICTGLSYSELASAFNKNGGEYYYVKEAFNEPLAKAVGFMVIMLEILSINSVTFGLSNHLSTLINLPSSLISMCVLLLFAGINYSGIRSSVNYNNVTTVIEVLGLLIIGFAGCFVSKTNFSLDEIQKMDLNSIMGVLLGSAFIYFAFVGFDFVIELSEETKNASVVLPRAMMTGILISTALYLMISVTAVSTIGWKKLSKSLTPMADVAQRLYGANGYKLLLITAMVSMSNTILMGHVGASRFIQSIAKELSLPFNMEKIDEKTFTPINAIIFVTVITMFGLLMGGLEKSVSITNIFTLTIFFMVNICAIKLRGKIPDEKRKFKIPLNVNNIPIPSVIGAVSSVLLGVVLIKYQINTGH